MTGKNIMHVQEISFGKLLDHKDVYKIPEYQRPYSWNIEQWEDLFNDIKELNEDEVHFLGSIIVVPEGPHKLGTNYFYIVDGQQRLATLLTLLIVIRDLAKEKGNNNFADYINNECLYNIIYKDNQKKKESKLILGKQDNNVFQRILESEKVDENHLIYNCYKFFREKILKEDLDLGKIFDKIRDNIVLVHINAITEFNAFRLFETLNDRGLELSATDLIKTYILNKVSNATGIFDNIIEYWNEMYEKIRDKDPVKFIRRFMLSQFAGKFSEKKLYGDVRLKLENKTPQQVFSFVSTLNDYATIYKKIYDCAFSEDTINKRLNELQMIEVSPSFTLLLKVMPYFESNEMEKDDVLEIMDMIEVFHIRWGICNQATSRLDRIYNEICLELDNTESKDFKNIIAKKLYDEIKNNVNDEIFKVNFCMRDFTPNQSRTRYILWKLSEPTGETILNLKEIETDHILPQKLNKNWKDYLISKGYNEDEINILHRDNLNKIGNLTIIKGGWNKSMSNKLFVDKKQHYQNSEISITKDLTKFTDWTFKEIKERTEELANKALNIWNWRW
jgi:uncharacterized protein with ParB-like and HNH nuclease domain